MQSKKRMHSIDEQFDEYRDCLRIIWNLSLRHRLKGVVSLQDVSETLFGALVLDDLENSGVAHTTKSEEGYYPGVGIVVNSDAPDLLFGVDNESGTRWEASGLPNFKGAGLDIRYVGLWDFTDFDKYRDFEYVEGYVLETNGSRVPSRRIVLRRSDSRILDLTFARDET
jgi:hypothetical protein